MRPPCSRRPSWRGVCLSWQIASPLAPRIAWCGAGSTKRHRLRAARSITAGQIRRAFRFPDDTNDSVHCPTHSTRAVHRYFERLLYECAAVGVFTDAQEKAMLLDARKAKKAAAAAAAAVVTSDAAEVEPAATSPPTDERAAALQARIEQIGVEIQAAMKARKTEDIRALMSERTTTQAELKALTP